MKRNLIPTLLLVTALQLAAQVQVPDPLYFVAGMPDRSFYQNDYTQTYTANILKYEQDSLQEIFTLKDSTVNYLNYLRYYPDLNVVITLNETGYEPERELEIVEYSTKTLKAKTLKIPPIKQFKGLSGYEAFTDKAGIVVSDDILKHYLEYINIEVKRDNPVYPPSYFGIFEGSRYVPKNVETQADIYRNSCMAGPFFGSVGGRLALQSHPTERLLVIPSYLEEDSVFHVTIPEQAQLTPKKYAGKVLINTDRIRLMFYYKGSDGKRFYDLYNKEQKRYYQYPYDQSNQNVKLFGDWIAGPTRLTSQERNKGTYQGKHPGQDQWNLEHNKYGLAVGEYVSRKLKRLILSGYLAIRSINDPTIFIEWDTRQGDSEILNIIDEVVYYRKHDEIWYVPIIDGEKLGNHKRLLKHDHVPGIHFMFVRG